MATCTSTGFPGTNVPLPSLIADSKPLTGFITGYTQASAKQTVSIYQTGTSTPVATITGSGTNQNPMTSASFPIQPGQTYYATVSSTTGQTARVLTAYVVVSWGTTNYAGAYILCGEDSPNGGDCDFNDCVVTISWTLYAG